VRLVGYLKRKLLILFFEAECIRYSTLQTIRRNCIWWLHCWQNCGDCGRNFQSTKRINM